MKKEILELRKELNMVSNQNFPNLFLGAGYWALNKLNSEKEDYLVQAKQLVYGMPYEIEDISISVGDLELNERELVEAYYALLDGHYIFTSTRALDEIIYNIVDIKDNSDVLDYCCGYGSFLKNIINFAANDNKKVNALGIELNYTQAIVTNLVMDLLGVKADIANKNALELEPCDFDLAFTIPPIKAECDVIDATYKNMELFNSRSSNEWIFIYKLLQKLNDKNKIVAILAEKPLHSLSDWNFRKYLIENKLIEAVVALPVGLITGVNINMNLVVFSKNNETVRIKNFTNKFDRTDINKANFVENFIDLYNNNDTLVDYKDCRCRNELVPELYLGEKISFDNGKALNEISSIRLGSQYTISHFKEMITTKNTGWYLLTPGDIVDGEINYDNLTKFNPGSEENKLIKHVLKENDIVITSKSSTLKIAMLDRNIGNLVVTGGMYIVTPDAKQASPLFLKLFLESEKGQECLNRIKKGTVIKSIDKKSLEEMEVECPRLEYQRAKTSEYRVMQVEYAQVKAKLDFLKSKLDDFKNKLSR